MRLRTIYKQATVYATSAAFAISLLLPASTHAQAASSNVQEKVAARTEQEVIEKWHQYLPQQMNSSNYFEVNPSFSAPYSAGKLKDNILKDGLNATNFARYLAGLPDDITLDYTIEEQQQAGAVLVSTNGALSHYPAKPTDMSEEFYQLGYSATTSSNLSAGRSSLYETVMYGYMSDNGTNNLDTVGHRRWIINPEMKQTMFGLAMNSSSKYSTYSSMYAFNRDRDENEVQYDYIAWPSAGVFPNDLLLANDPWSVSLNTNTYDKTKSSDITVSLTRERDQKTWSFDHSDHNYSGDFFNVQLSNYGIDFAIIFRPGDVTEYKKDDVFHVKIDGLYNTDGSKTSISYTTSLFQLQSRYVNSSSRYMIKGEQLMFPVEGAATRFVSSNPSVASVDANGVVTAHKQGYVNITVDGYLRGSNQVIQIDILDKSEAPIGSWAKSSIKDANKYGLLNSNPYYYDLSKAVTREKFVSYVTGLLTALDPTINLQDYYSKKSPFSDVYDGQADIIWAYENKIINGTGQGKFSPQTTISREQAATLLLNVYNYLEGDGKATTKAPQFADEANIASWATFSVKRAAELSLMNGVSATKFDPKGKYSHEQTIVTMVRLYKMFSLK